MTRTQSHVTELRSSDGRTKLKMHKESQKKLNDLSKSHVTKLQKLKKYSQMLKTNLNKQNKMLSLLKERHSKLIRNHKMHLK